MPELAIRWPVEQNEHGGRMLWAAAWLVGHTGEEGGAIYSGRGGEVARYAVPSTASGVRIRRWPNEGLEPEYVDVFDLNGGELHPERLDFDQPQPFSRLMSEALAPPSRERREPGE
jgi:hypothetical protein